MTDVFFGSSYNGTPTAQLHKTQVSSFKDFCEKHLKYCDKGEKNEYYITIGDSYKITKGDPSREPGSYTSKDHYKRNNDSQVSAWLLPFDGDSSLTNKDSCISPRTAHETLVKLDYNHVIYTTHSHVRDIRNRFRILIPCTMLDKSQLKPTVNHLYRQLVENGCDQLALSNESKTWSVPWFLPTRSNPDDGHYEYYAHFEGKDYKCITVDEVIQNAPTESSSESRSTESMITIIREGIADTGLHEATRDLANGMIKDGVAPTAVKAMLHGLTAGYSDDNPRQVENKNKIDKLVDSANLKFKTAVPIDTIAWKKADINDRVYTRYPDQQGSMENLVQFCMEWMHYPNRQIAITSAHALISTLGGRVYTLPTGSGVTLTTLVTGRSTIGKSNIKKFCIWALNNFMLVNAAPQFIGSHFYTSSKNLVDELMKAGSLLSVRTESGQSDKSSAGDMNRVMMYELELATESGRDGYVSSGGQNDKIPDLYSPAVTTIRESVAQIQNEADIINASSISGIAGRRSHVIIDPIKGPFNHNRKTKLPEHLRLLILEIYKLASDERRKNIDEPLDPDLWITIKYKNKDYLVSKLETWRRKENDAAAMEMHFESTFYGRLGQRVPAYAARLAICDNPVTPIITDDHLVTAEASLVAEFDSNRGQQLSGDLDNPWDRTTSKIVELFEGNLMEDKRLVNYTGNTKEMLMNGCISWTAIAGILRYSDEMQIISKQANFHTSMQQHLNAKNIILLDKDTTTKLYGKRSRIFQRIT